MSYIPKVNDYVKWRNHEGWVYFKCNETISIEIAVKDKYSRAGGTHHKKDHVLLVCQRFQWGELEYIKSRKSIHD
jgi:hypothetical protein